MLEKYVIIVAAGSGKRMKSNIPKQFLTIAGIPILMHTIKRFWNYDNNIKIIVVLAEDQIKQWKKLCKEYRFNIIHEIRKGGATRYDSVKNGLRGIKSDCLVAIHDGVRPLVNRSTIERCFNAAYENPAVIPVIPVNESLRLITETGRTQAVNRENYLIVQTPQVFQSDVLKKSYKQKYNPIFTDDATVVEHSGYPITTVEGNVENIKITTKIDLIIAEALFKNYHYLI